MKDQRVEALEEAYFDTLEQAESRAIQLTEETGNPYVAYKSTFAFKPYIVSAMPKVGDDVSMTFNGDSYPVGKIVRISKTYNRITTDEGVRFTRVGPNSWKQGGKKGAFSLIVGIHEEQNPHF